MGRRRLYEQNDLRLCLECGDAIDGEGRLDRKFCCEECKNKYHYKSLKNSRNIRNMTGTKLNRNHEVLDGLVSLGITSISRTEASLLGLDTEFMTSCRVVRGHLECSCYDISYRLTGAKLVNISKCLSTFGNAKE